MQYTEGWLTSSWAHRISTRSKCWVEYWCTGDHTSIRDPKLALDFELALDLDKWIPSWNIFHFCSIFLDRPLKIYQYKSVGIWFSDVCSLKLVFRVLFTVFGILIYLKWILIKPRMTVLSTGQTSRLSSTQIIPITDFSIILIEIPTNIIISGL